MMEDMSFLHTFRTYRDYAFTELVLDELDAAWGPYDEWECTVIERVKLTLEPAIHRINVWCPAPDCRTWEDGLSSELSYAIECALDRAHRDTADYWTVRLRGIDDFSEMVLTDGAYYREDPRHRVMPPADETWHELSKMIDKCSPKSLKATSLVWLAYARVLVKGPLNVLEWIYNHLSIAATQIAKIVGSHDAIVTLGFQTIEDCVGDRLCDFSGCQFSVRDRLLLEECKIAWMRNEYVLYAPYDVVPVAENHLGTIRSDLVRSVTLVPVPFVPVSRYLSEPFTRSKASIVVL